MSYSPVAPAATGSADPRDPAAQDGSPDGSGGADQERARRGLVAAALRAPLLRRVGLRIVGVTALLVIWWVAAARTGNPVIIPSPGAVWHQLVQTSTTHDGTRGYQGHLLIEHLGISLQRILLGSAIGIVIGLPLGLVMGTISWIRIVIEPLVTFLRALPPLAYFSLLIIWFGIDEKPKIWLLAIAAMPPVAVAAAAATAAAPIGLVEAARALGAKRRQVLSGVVLPSAIPEIFTGIRIAVGIAYSSVVAAETVNGLPGIGGMVRDAQRYNQSDIVILGIIVIGLSGLAIDIALRTVADRVTPWRGRT
jgi:taurine transport system permease protein